MIGVFYDILNAVSEVFFTETFAESLPVAVEKVKPKVELVQKLYGDKE